MPSLYAVMNEDKHRMGDRIKELTRKNNKLKEENYNLKKQNEKLQERLRKCKNEAKIKGDWEMTSNRIREILDEMKIRMEKDKTIKKYIDDLIEQGYTKNEAKDILIHRWLEMVMQ